MLESNAAADDRNMPGTVDPASPSGSADRSALLSRWSTLTREILPAMARLQRWPIALDHCFMRVCLDAAIGQRWDTVVRRPAIRHLTSGQLARAVGIAEGIVEDPARLPGLNNQSLHWRGVKPRRTGRPSINSP